MDEEDLSSFEIPGIKDYEPVKFPPTASVREFDSERDYLPKSTACKAYAHGKTLTAPDI